MPNCNVQVESDSMAAFLFQAMVDAGRVKAIGLSEFSVEESQRIHSIVPVSVFELEWSLFARDQEARPFQTVT